VSDGGSKKILITVLSVTPDVTSHGAPENFISKKLSKDVVAMNSLFAVDAPNDDNVGDDGGMYNVLLAHSNGKNVTTNSKKRKEVEAAAAPNVSGNTLGRTRMKKKYLSKLPVR
jgi:hypothetical protein